MDMQAHVKIQIKTDARKPVDVVFLDFDRAFDSVYHCYLCVKLDAYAEDHRVGPLFSHASFLQGLSM